MNKLVKPQKQSYTGEDSQILAYSDTCEMTWATAICTARPWFGLGRSPFLAATGVTCLLFSTVCSAVRNAYI